MPWKASSVMAERHAGEPGDEGGGAAWRADEARTTSLVEENNSGIVRSLLREARRNSPRPS
jgi:hypothetical protein